MQGTSGWLSFALVIEIAPLISRRVSRAMTGLYEDGRAVANALLAKGIDPTKVSLVDQAVWLLRLTLDGTIISDRPGAPCGSHS